MIISNKEQLTTVAKRIQSRLSKQGVKVALGDIKPMCETMISDINKPSEDEITLLVEHFVNERKSMESTAIAIVELPEGKMEELETKELPETPAPASLANTTQNQLITTTADTMGIVLNTHEILEIKNNLNSSTDAVESEIEEIRNAILAFVKHKSLLAQSKINQMVNDVRRVVSDENQANSILLSDGLKSINDNMKEANKDFKSNVRTALNAFAIPSEAA